MMFDLLCSAFVLHAGHYPRTINVGSDSHTPERIDDSLNEWLSRCLSWRSEQILPVYMQLKTEWVFYSVRVSY